MTNAPEMIWAYPWHQYTSNNGSGQTEYRRADLLPTLAAAMGLPEVQALVAAAERLAEWAEQLRACGDAGSWEWAAGDEYSETIAALAPFTEATL
jgi:hypothetical protein